MVCVDTLEEVLELNETREFWIITSGEEQGQNKFILSIRHLEEKLAWERLHQMKAENATVYAKVVATSTDEVLVHIEGLHGCIYNNELVTNKPIEELIGEILPLKIRYADEDGKSLNLSHNQALVARQIKQLKVSKVVVGTVRHIKHFGVFVDIGGLVGLLRITEISHEHFDSLHSIFKVNEQLKVMLLDLDFERNIISLSTKALEPEAGDMLRNPQIVYEKAEEMAAKYRAKFLKEYGGDAIKKITGSGLEYIDENGDIKFIDFTNCVQNSLEYFTRRTSKYVALRNVLGEPWGTSPYMQFFTIPLTKFLFNDEEDFNKLRWQIEQTGWLTFDLT